jgi:hypothetical protein
MTDIEILIGEDRFKIMEASCTCGGRWAWLRQRPSGAWEMIGCVCHHTAILHDLKVKNA